MTQIFDLIFGFFSFINTIIETISDTIGGIILLIGHLGELILSITYIIPYPLYPCFMSFQIVFWSIFTYKLLRKG